MSDHHADPVGAQAGEGSGPRQPVSVTPRLELRDVYKSFGGVHVLEDVDFALQPSEVVGLLGDNGAGKSTLIKIITGVHQPDRGTILFNGQPVTGLTSRRPAPWVSRPSTRSAPWPSSSRSGATSSWAAPSGAAWVSSTSPRCGASPSG